MDNNYIPGNIRTVHLIAVCGTAMSAVAAMLKDMGFSVIGSDSGIYPPMSDFLAHKGIEVYDGFKPENLAYKPDLIIVGNAVRRDNPEAQEMFRLGLNYCSMPQAINHFLADSRKTILISGTHGKTTTSSLMAWLLYEAGLDPSFMIGGILKNFNSNYRVGKGEYVVIEGDEYDTAFFDKGSKFLHYDPKITILTSVEFDHADIFRDLAHVKQAFLALISKLSAQSTLIAFDEDENIDDLIRNAMCRTIRYGRRSLSDWHIGNITFKAPISSFDVSEKNKQFGKFESRLMGQHNLLNALSVIAAANEIGISRETIAKALLGFSGVKRRQEVRGQTHGITVMDDFAHHPTAVKETIRAVKLFYPNGRLIAVFEPRTNTSMRQVFQNVYPLCFDEADMVCIRKPSRLDKVPEHERFSSEKLVEDLNTRGKEAYHFEDTDKIIEFLLGHARYGDVILVMSNGGFDNIHERLLKYL